MRAAVVFLSLWGIADIIGTALFWVAIRYGRGPDWYKL